MFRLSNIIGKNKSRQQQPETPAQSCAQPVSFPAPAACAPAEGAQGPAHAVSAGEYGPDTQARDAYQEALTLARQVYQPGADYSRIPFASVTELVGRILHIMESRATDILLQSLAGYDPCDFLCRHALNVSCLSLYMGRAAGYDHDRVAELGEAAFYHDIGMVKYLPIILKKARLGRDEIKKIRRHPQEGGDLLKSILPRPSSMFIDAILQEHERCNASGYPQGLGQESIGDYARVIGIVDVYEALVHGRPYRAHFTPLDAVKIMLGERALFDRSQMKLLLDHIGIYPCGVFVRLSTQETGVVIRNNPQCPLRPAVRVVYDVNGKPVTSPKTIDLHETTIISIEQICSNVLKQ